MRKTQRSWTRFVVNALLLSLPVLSLAACRSNVDDLLNYEFQSAQSLFRSERYDLALHKAKDGLRRAERARNSMFEWRFRLLKVAVKLGQRKMGQALNLLDSYGDPPAGGEWAQYRGRAFLLRGYALYLSNRYSDAQYWLSRAAEAANLARSASLSAEVELRRGAVIAMGPHPEDARHFFDNVIEASARLHDTYLEANATGNIGRSLQIKGHFDEAIPWFEQARKLFSELGANESIARTDENIGTSYFRLGEYDNARSHYEQALAVFEKAGNRNEQQLIIGNIGSVFYEAGDYDDAAAFYKRALAIGQTSNSKAIADWLSNLAATSIELKDLDAAERYNNEARDAARKLEDRRSDPNFLINAARIAAARGRAGEAADLFQSALKGQPEDPSVPLDAHAGLAEFYSRQGLLLSAEEEFGGALKEIDQRASSLRTDEYKISYAASLIRFYGKYVDFLIANNKPEPALEVAESSRARVLEERTGRFEPVKTHTDADYQRMARRAHAVLLEYWLGPTHSYLWVITPERVRFHVLPAQSKLHPLIERYRAYTMGLLNPLEVAADTGQELYKALLAPVMDDAPKDDHFIIVPDGDLHAFNLETLPAGQNRTKFWIESATVAIAPSLNYLAGRPPTSDPRSKVRPKKGLLIGDPVETAEYPRLKYAGQEMDSIASAMGVREPLRGAKATPEAYTGSQTDRFDFIHFAAHAIANQNHPLDSAVILSGAPGTFRLSALDVSKHPLKAEIVTISACRSAGAKTYGGEGLVGFAWAFLKAGAENVVAGLWDVNDESTAKLMTGLYTNIAAGYPAPDALQMSKLTLIRAGGTWAKPLYWAPFELYMGAYRER